MRKKILIGLIILLIILIIIITTIYVINKDKQNEQSIPTQNIKEEIKYNTNENFIEEKNIDNIVFTDIECSFDGTYSLITYKIINKNTTSINLENYEIIVKDKDNNILANISPTLTIEIQPNEEIETGNAIDMNLTDAYSLELVLAKQ